MCSIRALWCLYSLDNEREVLFSRRFNTVERKEQRAAVQAEAFIQNQTSFVNGENFQQQQHHQFVNKNNNNTTTGQENNEEEYKYTTIPATDRFLLDSTLFPLPNLSSPVTQIPPIRLFPPVNNFANDEVINFEEQQLLNEKAKGEGLQSPLWPLVFASKRGIYWIAVPALLHNIPKSTKRPKLIDLNCVTMALSMLNQIHDLMQLIISKKNISSIKSQNLWEEMNQMISAMMPFGTPIDTQPERIFQLTTQGFPPHQPPQSSLKRPSWKPYNLAKGKPSIEYIIEEKVQSVQYDNPLSPDVTLCSGSILCTAILPGTPEVSLSLTTNPSSKTKISDLSFAPFVQLVDGDANQRKLNFAPPLEKFNLCDYSVVGFEKPPIRGFYQMKQISMTQVKILVQLKLTDGVNNQFEKFLVKIPFYNRGKIINADVSQNPGIVKLLNNSINWDLAPKITTRNNEMVLRASVSFDLSTLDDDYAMFDPFCVDQNAFIDVTFEIEDYSVSSIQFDSKISSAQNVKLPTQIKKVVKSSNYKIWNSLGCSPKALNISLIGQTN